MTGNSEANQRGATNGDERVVTVRGVPDRTKQTDVRWANSRDLRAITPEEIQLLAATGC